MQVTASVKWRCLGGGRWKRGTTCVVFSASLPLSWNSFARLAGLKFSFFPQIFCRYVEVFLASSAHLRDALDGNGGGSRGRVRSMFLCIFRPCPMGVGFFLWPILSLSLGVSFFVGNVCSLLSWLWPRAQWRHWSVHRSGMARQPHSSAGGPLSRRLLPAQRRLLRALPWRTGARRQQWARHATQ